MVRPIPKRFFTFIKAKEAVFLRVYDDKNPGKTLKPGDPVEGVLTAGAGHTGPDLKIGMTVTTAMSDAWLRSDALRKAAMPLENKVGADAVAALTENQYVAVLSFVYNLGTGDPKKPEWTIWYRVRERQWDQVPGEMIQFVNWNGKRSKGLLNRRQAEIEIWEEGRPESHDEEIPSSITRREPTPPTPQDPVPPSRSPTVIASITGAVASAPVMINSVAENAQPYVKAAGHAQEVFAPLAVTFAAIARMPSSLLILLAVIGAGAAAFAIYRVLHDKKLARN